MRPDQITELDCQAYLDGELDLHRRLAVEAHLAEDAEAAARFMADLRDRSALRMLIAGVDDPSSEMLGAAARLADRLNQPPRRTHPFFGRRMMQMAAAAAMIAVVAVPARNVFAQPPSFVGDAVEAYHTGLLRAQMVSQVETPRFDAGEVQRSTRIRVPRLPPHWVVTDAQIFPSKEGPALQLMIRTPSSRKLSIFAVRARTKAPEDPITVRSEGATAAYWSDGDMSYALIGGGDEPAALDMVAEDIAAAADGDAAVSEVHSE